MKLETTKGTRYCIGTRKEFERKAIKLIKKLSNKDLKNLLTFSLLRVDREYMLFHILTNKN